MVAITVLFFAHSDGERRMRRGVVFLCVKLTV